MKLVAINPTPSILAEHTIPPELEAESIDDFSDLAIDIAKGRLQDDNLYRRTAEQRANAQEDRITAHNHGL